MSPDAATFTHEARTHLTVLIGRLQLLRRRAERHGTGPDLTIRQLDELHERVVRLSTLVDELDTTGPPRSSTAGKPPRRSEHP